MRLGATVVGGLLVIAAWAAPAASHSELIDSAPEPGQTVGGVIDRIDLEYELGVSNVVVTVTGPNGVVDSEVEQTSDTEVIVRLAEPIADPGQWIVDHELLAADGDITSRAFAFEYDPGAPGLGEGGSSSLAAIALLGGAVLIAGAFAAAAVKMRRARPASSDDA